MVPVLAWVCGALTVRDAYSARYHTPVNSCGALLALRTLSPTPIRRRTAPTSGPRVDGQHVFHGGYERAIGLRRDDPLLLAMGPENVFFRTRPIVLSLARSTISSSTTFFSNIRKVQRARPWGGLEQANAINLASFSPSKIRATAGVARCLRLKTASRSYGTAARAWHPHCRRS